MANYPKPHSGAPSPTGKSTKHGSDRRKQIGDHQGGGGPAATSAHGSPKGMSPTYGGPRPKHPSKVIKSKKD